MKPFKQILIWLTLLMITASAIAKDDVEKWRKDMTKNYAKVLKETKKQSERHRKLVRKWQEKEHLEALTHLYESDLEKDSVEASFYYGLGYAYALQGKDSYEKAADKFRQAIELDFDLFFAHFSLGGIYQQQENYDLALEEMETCLGLNPKYYAAHYKRGEIYLKHGELDQALEAFQAANELKKKWEYPYYGMGLVYFAQGNDSIARENFEQAINRNKKFAPAYFKLGQVLAKGGFFDDASQEYKKGSKYQPYTAEVLYELAVIFAEEGESPRALSLYQRAVEIDPQYAPAHIQLGELYYSSGQRELAIEHYKQAIAADSSFKDYFIEQLAPYHAGLMGTEEAKVLMDKSLAVDPGDPRVHFYYAQIEADAGNIDDAIQHYEKTIEAIEADESLLEMELPLGAFMDAYLALGDLYYQGENTEKAVETYRRAIELDPDLELHFFELGKTAFDAEEFDLAIEPFDKFLLIFPTDVEANYLLGRSYESLENLEEALQSYARVIELDGKHFDALMRSAKIYRQQSHPQNALNMLDKLIAVYPENVEAHYLSGLSHLELNHVDDALASFVETARLDPNHVDAHYQSGLLYEQKGDIDNAVARYERTIELNQSNADPFLRLGRIYLKRDDKDNVIRVYELGLELEPDHPQAQYDLAAVFEEQEANEKAIKRFGLANQYDGSHFDWHFRYARLLDHHVATLEDYDRYAAMAVEEYSKTTELKPEYAPGYFYRGLITRRYKRIGETLYRSSQIAEDFKQVTELEPRNADAHYYLALTYVDLDERKQAKGGFRRTLELNEKYKDANLQIGLIAEWEQKFNEAIDHFEAEVAINPKSAKAYQRLGTLYNVYKMDFGRAGNNFKKAVELEPNHVETLLNYGNALFNLDRLGGATEQFELVLQLEAENLSANFNLALMYQYRDKKEQAIDRWKKFLELNPPAEWKTQAEQSLRQLGSSP